MRVVTADHDAVSLTIQGDVVGVNALAAQQFRILGSGYRLTNPILHHAELIFFDDRIHCSFPMRSFPVRSFAVEVINDHLS